MLWRSQHVDDVGQEHEADDGEEHQYQDVQHDVCRTEAEDDQAAIRAVGPLWSETLPAS